MERILLIMPAASYWDGQRALRSAKDNAANPGRLSFGVLLSDEPDQAAQDDMRGLGSIQYIAPSYDVWREIIPLWRGEQFILMGHPAMRFERHWDRRIRAAWKRCPREIGYQDVLLTGYLPRPEDPVDAASPVAAEAFDGEGRLCFHRGTPLRYAKQPQISAFLHPWFVFGPAAFYKEADASELPLFLTAHVGKWMACTLHDPLIRCLWDEPLPPFPLTAEVLHHPRLGGWERRFGIRLGEKKLTAMARRGVYTVDMSFPMEVPLGEQVREGIRQVTLIRGQPTPLFVTAFVDLPTASANMPEEYALWFRYLSALRGMALLCYADGDMARRLTASFPNVLGYKRRYGIELPTAVPASQGINLLKAGKVSLLAHSREKFLNHTHYAWIDFGYLRYPVWEGVMLDMRLICTREIVMATVDGRPDPSLIVVPEDLLTELTREVQVLCAHLYQLEKRVPEEERIWNILLAEHPQWFRLVEMAGRRELFTLTMAERKEVHHDDQAGG